MTEAKGQDTRRAVIRMVRLEQAGLGVISCDIVFDLGNAAKSGHFVFHANTTEFFSRLSAITGATTWPELLGGSVQVRLENDVITEIA